MSKFMARFREHPLVRTLEERFEFATVATVETKRAGFRKARDWALAPEPFRQLQGRVRPHNLHPESGHVLWEFEHEDDAILFACKFGGQARGPVDPTVWRAAVLKEMENGSDAEE